MSEIHHDALAFLRSRASVPSRLLSAPGPDREQLLSMLDLAMRVPDHGRLEPWRFLLIEGAARAELGRQLAARKRALEPDASAEVLAKELGRFNAAPCIVAVLARLLPEHKIPEREQLLSVGAVTFQLLLVAQAHGYGAQWLTGWAAYDAVIGAALGLASEECVVGFVHIGSTNEAGGERPRPRVMDKFSVWQPSPPPAPES